jgi:hypothetical protein
MTLWTLGPTVGPAIGPIGASLSLSLSLSLSPPLSWCHHPNEVIVGGYLTQAAGWRWNFWVLSIAVRNALHSFLSFYLSLPFSRLFTFVPCLYHRF